MKKSNFLEPIKTKLNAIKFNSWMLLITAFYAMGSILINLMAVKTLGVYDIIDYNTHFGDAILPITTAGTLISWLVFACMDIIGEVNGKKKAIQTFWIVGIINLVLTIIAAVICFIPGNPWTSDTYAGIFAGNWGITLASMLAFILGNYANTIILCVMHARAKDKKSGVGFAVRVGVSTLVGQFIDNALFYILALAPVFGLGGFTNPAVRFDTWGHLFTVVGFTTLFELGVELLFTPLFHKFSQFLIKKKEEEEAAVSVVKEDTVDQIIEEAK